MTKPKQPLQAVRRGIRAMSGSSPMRGLRSISPGTRKGEAMNDMEGSRRNKSSSSNQNHKPIRDEVIGRISPEKMRKEKHQRKGSGGYDSRDDTGNVGSSRGRSNRRDQPSTPDRRRNGWDTKLEMPRGTVLDHLADFSMDPPPPPPPRDGSSPRRSSKEIAITTGEKPTKSSRKKQQSRRQKSSSPSRRQQQQYPEHQKNKKHPPRSPQHRVQQPRIVPSTDSSPSLVQANTGTSRSTFSRSQLIENPQFASSSSSFSPEEQWDPRDIAVPPPPPGRRRSTSRSSPRSSPSQRSSPKQHRRRQRDENPATMMVIQNTTTATSSSDADWRLVRGDQWGATLNSSQSMDSFTAAKEWEADFDADEAEEDLWKFDSRLTSRRKRDNRMTDSRDQDVLDSRQEKYSSSYISTSTAGQVIPSSSPLVRNDRDAKQRGNGFLNFFGSGHDEDEDMNSSGARKGRANLAAEMLEIGSEATLTAGDLIMEESSMASTSLIAISGRESDSKIFFPDDNATSNFHTATSPSRSAKKTKQKQKEQSTSARPHIKKKNLSGDYLQSKLLQLESANLGSGREARQDDTDDSVVSNLTEPTIFKNGTPSPKHKDRDTRDPPRVGAHQSPMPSKQRLSLTTRGAHTRSPRSLRGPHSSMEDPQSSWEATVPPNGNAALDRSLDMQFMSQTPMTAQDVISPTASRPPLLPKATMASSSAAVSSVSEQQHAPTSSLPMTRRQKMRSRTPSPAQLRQTTQGKTPLPGRTKSRTPSPQSRMVAQEIQDSVPAVRQKSPFRRRMESSKAKLLAKPNKNVTEDWSKHKDNLIEQRVAQSKTNAGVHNAVTQSNRKNTPASRGMAFKNQVRAASSSPGRKKAYEMIDNGPKTSNIMARARAQSATRAQHGPSNEPPVQRDMRRHDRVRGGPAFLPPTPMQNGARAVSTGKSVQKMESLSKVMSRVPSSLGSSRGGASDSIELKRKESERSFTNQKKTPQPPPRLRQASPARKAQAATPNGSGMKSAEGNNPENLYETKFSKRRSASREQQKVQVAAQKTYLPSNAYVGRFTPKKKRNDKVTQIRATREQEREVGSSYSTVASPRSPIKRHLSRHEGAQKLRNMIKLKNHFDTGSMATGDFDATLHLVRNPRQSTKSTRATDGRMSSQKSSLRSSSVSYSDLSVEPFGRSRIQQHDRMTMIREHGLIDSFSVGGSDLRSLRTALQSRSSNEYIALSHDDDYYANRYDPSRIADPMQRAGLRLLSAAVIPIQAAARRFLARREALSLLWAALVLQARVRAFLERRRYEMKVFAAITIQASARGMLIRDRLMFEDYCATEIQRCVRGHLAAVHVYETIYKISLVQSQVRMRLAIKKAAIRTYCVFKIQGLARGFLVRCRLSYAHSRATDIQRIFRGYVASMLVFDEVYKITLVQNQIRRKQALDKATMRMSMALSIQAAARGWLVRCRLEIAHYHATTIQRYARGYLGTMKVYEEIYKIMLIQNFFRMKIALNLATKRMTMIIRVQANWRRYCVLRRMDYAQYNAKVIQRYVRGYLATMTVYEEIYKITLVQNFVRMKHAQALADYRRYMIVQVQACVRGFILRGRLEKICDKAITIQSAWRAFYYRLVYQFKLLDIIILQSVWRRKQAYSIANQKRCALQVRAATIVQARWRCYDARETYLQYKIEDRAATIIQTQWRCYDTSMDYLHFLADVLIVQSMVRRWFAMREVTAILVNKSIVLQRIARGYLGRLEARRVRSAITIQRTWRGFVAFADYMFKIADIVVVQTVARRWFACRRANYFRHKIEHDAATVIQRWRRRVLARREAAATLIQKVWRGLVQEADFTITLYEFRAARTIQTYWRRFWKFSNYLICLDCSIRIQAVVRGFLARCRYADEQWGAVILQAAARGIVGSRRAISKKMVKAQTLNSNAIGSLESMAATVIQGSMRGYFSRGVHWRFRAARAIQALFRGNRGRVLFKQHVAARKVQAVWRCILAQEFYIQSVSAIKIQKHWRRMIYHAAYKRFFAARQIQNCWRTVLAKETLLCHKAERVAAVAIQSAWRGYLYYTNYLFSLCDIVKVQSIVRRHQAKKKLKALRVCKANEAAVSIQKSWRGFYAYSCFLITLSEIIRIQSLARKFLERKRILTYRATVIQKTWRGHVCFSNYASMRNTTIKVQCQIRRALAQRDFERHMATRKYTSAVLIQKTWKRHFCRSNYMYIVSDITKVQTEVRRFLAQKLFYEMWEKHAIQSAVKIQAKWRCYFACTNYLFVREDVIKLQAMARGFLARNTFLELFSQKCNLSVCSIQKEWRRYRDQKHYRGILTKVCLIQQRVRYYFAMKEIREEASILLQKTLRGYGCRTSYVAVRAKVILAQATCRRHFAMTQYHKLISERNYTAALTIQSSFRMSISRADFVHRRAAALDIQRYWRGFNDRIGLFVAWKQHFVKVHAAALEIQRVWRGYVVTQRYLYTLGSVIEIQSLARMILAKLCCRQLHEAATKIQAMRRRFLDRQLFLSLVSKKSYLRSKDHAVFLNKSVIKIQRVWRDLIRARCVAKSVVIINWFSKIAVAKLKVKRKIASHRICKFLLMVRRKKPTPELLLHTKKIQSALMIQAWYPLAKRLRKKRRNRAARIILRFFQMVKEEVDQEIEMELLRRKQRKQQRKRHHKKDDQILETAWEKTSRVGLDQPRRRRADGDKMIQDTLDEIQSRSKCSLYSGSPRNLRQRGAPPMLALADALEDQSVAQSSVGNPPALSPYNRPSPSRVESFSQKDFDEDYTLEEAFLDAEIQSAKTRRKTEKRAKGKSSRRKSSSASVASRASVGSRMSVGSRVSVGSRISTGTRESRETRASHGTRASRDTRASQDTRASRQSAMTESSRKPLSRGLYKPLSEYDQRRKR